MGSLRTETLSGETWPMAINSNLIMMQSPIIPRNTDGKAHRLLDIHDRDNKWTGCVVISWQWSYEAAEGDGGGSVAVWGITKGSRV